MEGIQNEISYPFLPLEQPSKHYKISWILKVEEDLGCVPYLLLERIEWNLLSLLEDRSEEAYLSQWFKVSIIHNIASGLSFLHSRRPRAIVHAALNSSSVLIDERHSAKLTDFFHAGYVGDPFAVI